MPINTLVYSEAELKKALIDDALRRGYRVGPENINIERREVEDSLTRVRTHESCAIITIGSE